MLKVRFLRVGKKNAPSFRLVLTDKDAPPRGRFLEILGFYNPYTKERAVKKERISYWISQGAQPSDTAHNFLVKAGVITGKKIAVHAKSKKEAAASIPTESVGKEKKEAAAPAAVKAYLSAKSSASAEAPKTQEAPDPDSEAKEKEEVAPIAEEPTEEEVKEEETVAKKSE